MQSKDIKDLAVALSKMQSQMKPAKRGAENPFFKSSYTDLAGLWDSIREPLSANGLAVVQTFDGDGELLKVVTTLLHTSGQWVRGVCAVKLAKADPQAVGSATTYARRYGLAAIVGACSEGEDDDGNAATHARPAAAKPAPRPSVPAQAKPAPARPAAAAPKPPASKGKPEAPRPHILKSWMVDTKNGPSPVVELDLPCPTCGGTEFWDGQARRKAAEQAGTNAPPAFRCRNRECDAGKGFPGAIWPCAENDVAAAFEASMSAPQIPPGDRAHWLSIIGAYIDGATELDSLTAEANRLKFVFADEPILISDMDGASDDQIGQLAAWVEAQK
ncbi:MAG: ERF family protein [bacterium]